MHFGRIRMDQNNLYKTLLLFCKEVSETENDDIKDQPKISDIWSSLYQIAIENPKHISIFFPLIKNFSLLVPDFQEYSAPEIESALSILTNCSNDYQTRFKASIPLISLISFLSFQQFGQIISSYIDLINQQISNESKFPEESLNLLDTIDFSFITEETAESVFDCVKVQVESEKQTAASLFLYASFSDCIFSANPDNIPTVCSWVIKNLQSNNRINQMSSLYLLEKSSIQLGSNLLSIPKNLFSSFSDLLIKDDDLELCYRAHKATRQLIANKILENKDIVKVIISQFPKYQEKYYEFFFKLIQRYLDNYEDANLEVVQEILDFVTDCLANPKMTMPYIKGKCIECISQIAAIDKLYIEDVYEEAFDIAIDLLDKENQCLTEVTNYFLMVNQSFPGPKVPIIYQRLPVLANSLITESKDCQNDEKAKKKLMERAASLASIVQSNTTFPDVVKTIVSFVISSLDSDLKTKGDLYFMCSVIIALRAQLDEESAKKIFAQYSILAKNETISPRLNAILHTMKKILTKFDVDPIASEFIDILIKGDIKFIGGFPLFSCMDEKTMIFYFVAAYIRKYPLKSDKICDVLIDCVPNMRQGMLPAVLEPLEAGIHSSVVPHDSCAKLYHEIVEITSKLSLEEDEEEVIACIEILSEIGRSNPDVFDGNELFGLIKTLIGELGDSNDDESIEDVKEMPPMGPITRFALELCILKYVKIEIDQELILKLVRFLPLSPQITSMENIMKLIVDSILPDKQKFGFLTFPCCFAITKLLILQDSELKEYDFDPQFVISMKNILKKMVHDDRNIEKQISMKFRSQRPKLNRFAKLLK